MRLLLCRLFLMSLVSFGGLLQAPASGQTRIINSNGGVCAFNGASGGLRVHTSGNSQFQVERCSALGTVDRSRQFFFSGSLPPANNLFNSMYLRVGNTIVGAQNSAGVIGAQLFRQISTSGGSALGDGSSTAVYAADVGGLTYTITQRVTYLFPNDFYTVDIEIDVPAANTQQVDFYSWTDLQLDGDDNGQCIVQTDFPRFAGGDNTAGNYFAGYRERDSTRSWDSFSCGFFADATRNADQIIGPARSLPNTNFTNNIDIGAATHWEVVDTGGTGAVPFQAQFDFIFSVKEATLTKRFGPEDEDNNDTISMGEITDLTFTLTNVPGNPAVGPITFLDTLPAGVEIVGTPIASQCGGAVSTGNVGGRDTVTLTGGQLNGGDASCEITLEVTSNVPGEHINAASNITGLTFAQNQVNAMLTVEAPVTGSISGSVFEDLNLNNTFDVGEPEISGITVTAFTAGTDGSFATDDDIAVASGETGSPYLLTVPAGDYQLLVDGSDPDLPNGVRPSITSAIAITVAAGDVISGQNFGVAPQTTAVPATPLNVNVCDARENWRQLQYDANGNASVDGLTANLESSLPSGGLAIGAFNTDTQFFDGAEHTPVNPGLGVNAIRYNETNLPGLLETFTQNFEGRAVYEVYIHLNSLDQFGFEFLAADNPDIGWEILSASDDGQNIASAPDLFFVDTIESDLDRRASDERLGGDAGRSADGTIRIYTLNNQPISRVVWRFREDPIRSALDDGAQLATEVCMPLEFSDAPLTGTSFGAASHGFDQTIRLGDGVTVDPVAFDSADASADASDDGVSLPILRRATPATIPVAVNGAGGFLQAWFDWNADGDFTDAGEQVAVDLQDTGGGIINLAVTPPVDAVLGETFARFRWSTQGGLAPDQNAPDGEVEDYQVAVLPGIIPINGAVFFDNGAGAGATAHDGLRQGDEQGAGGLIVQAIDIASGNVIARGETAGDGTYMLDLPPEQDGLSVQVRVILPNGAVLVSNRSTEPPARVDPAGGQFTLTPIAGDTFAGLDFGLAALPRLTENQSRTVLPGGATVFAHVFTAQSDMATSFSLQNEAQSVAGAFATVLFHDSNCNGAPDGGELPVTTALLAVAGQEVCLLVRVAADASLPTGVSLTFDLVANANFTGLPGDFATLVAPVILSNTDALTLSNAGSLVLTKEVCNASNGPCDALTGAGFAQTNRGLPGDILVYRIVFEVTGPEAVEGVSVSDRTPAFSALTARAPVIVAAPPTLSCALTAPAAPTEGFEGILSWICTGLAAPGSLGSVSFEVEIAD